MLELRYTTASSWVRTVMEHFDDFLLDHAAAEKKASGVAVSMLSHYPDKPELVKAMIDLSIEEMTHFREVVKILLERGLTLGADRQDHYVGRLRKLTRNGREAYFLDRLLIAAVIEARGCERFALVAEALPEGALRKFYRAITASEARHGNLFVGLAETYFEPPEVQARLDEILDNEALICESLPITAALH